MDDHKIYSIGHGSRTIEEFISLLKKYDISFLVDVRSKPASRFNAHFNHFSLLAVLKMNGIRYVYMGHSLGGMPQDESCYDKFGHVNYDTVKKKDFFLKGISRLESAFKQQLKIACMCSESSPCECHRSKLIGTALKEMSIPMVHIDRNGLLRDQDDVMREVMENDKNLDLFETTLSTLKSRKSYR